MSDETTRKMVLDYMEQGFLENIVSLFKQDPSLVSLIPHMIADERIRVRLGTVALAEDLLAWKADLLTPLLPRIGELLDHANPTIRGDAAHLLEIIGDPAVLPVLVRHRNDEHAQVREVIEEAIQALESIASPPEKNGA